MPGDSSVLGKRSRGSGKISSGESSKKSNTGRSCPKAPLLGPTPHPLKLTPIGVSYFSKASEPNVPELNLGHPPKAKSSGELTLSFRNPTDSDRASPGSDRASSPACVEGILDILKQNRY